MKRLITLTAVLLLSALLSLPTLAANTGAKTRSQLSAQSQKLQQEQIAKENQGRRLHKAYFQEREAMKERRDAGLKVRERNVNNNNPGNTGL